MITSVALVILVITSVPGLFIIFSKIKISSTLHNGLALNFVVIPETEKIFHLPRHLLRQPGQVGLEEGQHEGSDGEGCHQLELPQELRDRD